MIQPTSKSSHRLPALRTVFPAVAIAALVGCAAVLAQEGGAPSQAEFSDVGQAAFERFSQDDMQGAIDLLEAHYKAGKATNVDRALLGTLYMETGRPAEALEALRVVADSDAADPAVLYNAGRAALALGEVEAASGYLERSTAKMPFSPAARELGLLRGAQGRVSEAFRLLRIWVSKNLGDTEARLALVAAGLRLERAAEVGPLLEGMPDEPRVNLLRGQHKALMGDLQGAIEILEKVLADSPPEMITRDAERVLANAYLDSGRPQDAVALLEGKSEGRARIALLLAEGQQKTGAVEAAVSTLRPFAEIATDIEEDAVGPVIYRVLLEYGRTLAAAGKHADALPYLEKATRLRPRDPVAWKGLGDALSALGRREEAKQPLETFRGLAEGANTERRIAESSAQDPGMKAILAAQQAMSRGERQRALAILRQEVALSPGDVRPRLLEVRLLLILQRLEEALAAAEKTVELFPDNADAIYQRGVIHMGVGDTEAAAADLRRVLALAPEHIPAMNDLAVLLTQQGKKDEAKALLQRLVELSPDNELALENLQKMQSGSGG